MILYEDAKGTAINQALGMGMLIGVRRLFLQLDEVEPEWKAHGAQVAMIQNLGYSVCPINIGTEAKIGDHYTDVTFCGRPLHTDYSIDKGSLILYNPKTDRELGRIVNLKEPSL